MNRQHQPAADVRLYPVDGNSELHSIWGGEHGTNQQNQRKIVKTTGRPSLCLNWIVVDSDLPACATINAYYLWYKPEGEHRNGLRRYAVESLYRNSSAGTRRYVHFGRNNLSLLSKVAPGIAHG